MRSDFSLKTEAKAHEEEPGYNSVMLFWVWDRVFKGIAEDTNRLLIGINTIVSPLLATEQGITD